jgi:citrate lyase subunit beta/citryl-CoA lyase
VPHYPHLILLPKCEHATQLRQVDDRIQDLLKAHGQKREIFLMPIIESCLGVENAFEIASASKRVVAMAIGLEDYTADLGVKRSDEGRESLYARTRLVNACKAAGIQPIDSVFSDVADMEGLKRTWNNPGPWVSRAWVAFIPGRCRSYRRPLCPGKKI